MKHVPLYCYISLQPVLDFEKVSESKYLQCYVLCRLLMFEMSCNGCSVFRVELFDIFQPPFILTSLQRQVSKFYLLTFILMNEKYANHFWGKVRLSGQSEL